MLRVGIAVFGAVLTVAPAFAARVSAQADALDAPASLCTTALRASYSETFETFNTGALLNQGGWTGYSPNIAVISDTPIAGAKSARHTSDGSDFIGYEISSPTFTAGYGILAAHVRLSGANVTYQFNTLSDRGTDPNGTFFYFNTGVQFQPGGAIRVLQYVTGGGSAFAATTGTWTPNVPFQIAVEVLADGTLNIYRNTALIFSGLDIAFAATGTAGRTKQYVGWTDNAVGYAGQSMTLDNFTNVLAPEPASLTLLALALVARRRAS